MTTATSLFFVSPIASIIALLFAFMFFKAMKAAPEGNKRMIEISNYVKEGSKAFLKQQYKIVAIFFIFAFIFFIFLAYILQVQSYWAPFVFLTGGFFSGLAGYIGMITATHASARTAEACRKSLNSGLVVAFRSGAVMGLTVVGLGLLSISIWFIILGSVYKDLKDLVSVLLTFAIGASFQALFARVGGGIFTKAADVGADLVGKIENNIPEDDPRNPAVIADNVGDMVGDCAGMGADLYESFCGSILATCVLGVAAFSQTQYLLQSVILPMVLAGMGIIASIIGIYRVKSNEKANQAELLKSLSKGVNLSSIIIIILSGLIIHIMMPGNLNLWGAMLSGLFAGIIIGKSTEFFTSHEYGPTKKVAQQGLTGPATLIINGMSVGMMSTGIPVITLGAAILLSYGFGNRWNWHDLSNGLYGIGISAVGMLSTLGITLATDAYGPIADNAGGNAEMSKLGEEVRTKTDALDALGNTTAATGKGFAIGSAALTAMALLAAYIEEVKIAMLRIGETTILIGQSTINTSSATIQEFVSFYNITLINPKVLIGLFIGSMTAFVFCALTLKSVGRAAGKMVDEVRRQFKEKKGIMEGTEKPDYTACITISTKASLKEMVLPSCLAFLIPLIVGILLGVAGVMGLLTGALTAGFTLAIMLNNAGAAWDNAKKYVEIGNYGGKNSEAHKASVIGDTVGDPFKDTSGPSLNILIKLMSMVSVIFAGIVVAYSPVVESLYERNENAFHNEINIEE